MGRQANPDIRRAFVEFNDEETPSKVPTSLIPLSRSSILPPCRLDLMDLDTVQQSSMRPLRLRSCQKHHPPD